MDRKQYNHVFLGLTLLFLTFMDMAASDLVAVYSVTRHAARNVLPKTANLSESEATGGPSLLPQGRTQAAAAGAAFAQRYIAYPACTKGDGGCLPQEVTSTLYGLVSTPRTGFSNYNTLANSSALDRTLATAYEFLGALFPAPSSFPVPVYSVAETVDFRIRGYTRCPAYQQQLGEWYTSPEFQSKEQETKGLRDHIQGLAPSFNISLANWWNVYDAFHVWRTYSAGDPMPDLDPETYTQVSELGNWLELAKMKSSITGNLLGGALLADLLTHLQAAAAAWHQGSQVYYKLLPIFGHYNTQLGLLAALGLDRYGPAVQHPWLSQKIPAAAAVLSVELHCNRTSSLPCMVRFMSQDGPDMNYTSIPLPCSDTRPSGAPEGACSLEAFVQAYQEQALYTAGDWCKACRNTATSACEAALLQAVMGEAAAADDLNWDQEGSWAGLHEGQGGGSISQDNGLAWKIAVSVLTSVVGTAGLMGLAGALWLRRFPRRHQWTGFGGPEDTF